MKYSVFIVAAASAAFANAQTWSACNPRERTDCPKDKALGCTYSHSYKTSALAASDFSFGGSGAIKYEGGAAKFRIAKALDAPTISSNFYIMYGKVDVRMKAAPGAGIVSSVVLQSDTLDEIDWEWLGGDQVQGQSNYFGKGNTTTYDRGAFHPVATQEFHTYGVEWTENTLTWLLDGAVVRTLNKADVKYDLYPQTPMQIKIGSWAGGDADHNEAGVVQWAGGPTDYKKGPFDMIIESIKITDYSNGQFYVYSDKSGSAKSIKSEGGKINVGPQNQQCGVVPPLPTSTTKPSTSKPVVETPKPTVEAPKPTVEAPKPTVEAPKPTVEAPKPDETETETEAPEVTATPAFPIMTAPFGNSTTTKGHEGSAQPTGGIETPIDEDDESATTTSAAEFPESTVVTTTLTQIQTVTTCLAVTTTDASGNEVTTSSTQTLTRTEKVTSVVTVPCETTTTTAPGGAVITTVVPGTIPVIATPTSTVTKPTEVPVKPETPGVPVKPETPVVPGKPETPAVPVKPETPGVPVKPETPVVPGKPETPAVPVKPEVPSVEVPEVEVPEVELPDVEVPEVEVPSVETPEVEIPDVEVPEVETPAGETPVEGNSPVVETPETPETPAGETPVEGNSPVAEQPPKPSQTYTTVTITTCSTVCSGSQSTGSPSIPSFDNSTAPVFNGSNAAPPAPVTDETELETPEEAPESNTPGTVIEAPIEFDGAATSLKGGLVGVVVAGVLGFLVL